MRSLLTAALASAVLLSHSTTALAQGLPPAEPSAPPQDRGPPGKPRPRPQPKPQGPQPAQTLSVANASANTALDVIVTGENQTARLGKPLGPKAQATLRLPKLKGCVVSVQAIFKGGGFVEVNDFDVCKENSIRFTE